MSTAFAPYLSFPGNGTEAMAYYHEIFGGNLTVMSYGDFPPEATEQFPFPVVPDALAHAVLESPTVRLTGGDAMAPEAPSLHSEAYSFLLSFDAVEEAEALIEKFTSTSGEVIMPFDAAPWGGYYGQVRDQFGVVWAFDVG